jgi:hypothetical protein
MGGKPGVWPLPGTWFQEPSGRSVTLKNTGQPSGLYGFACYVDSEMLVEEWLNYSTPVCPCRPCLPSFCIGAFLPPLAALYIHSHLLARMPHLHTPISQRGTTYDLYKLPGQSVVNMDPLLKTTNSPGIDIGPHSCTDIMFECARGCL